MQGSNPYAAFKLALAAWPRSVSDARPRLLRTVQALSRVTAGPVALLPDMKHDGAVVGALFDNVARLMEGNLVELACRLLSDKHISTLGDDFGIKITEPICANDGKDAPAPDFSELRD